MGKAIGPEEMDMSKMVSLDNGFAFLTAAEALEKAEEFLRGQIDTEVSRVEKLDALSALRPVIPRPPEEPVEDDEEEGDDDNEGA